ncbi:unnamed protein product [Laminaria digitata]
MGLPRDPTGIRGTSHGYPRYPAVKPWKIPIVPAGSHGKTTGFDGMPWGSRGNSLEIPAGSYGDSRGASHGIPRAPTARPTGWHSHHKKEVSSGIAYGINVPGYIGTDKLAGMQVLR